MTSKLYGAGIGMTVLFIAGRNKNPVALGLQT
jgi:hypothetical protein